MTRMTATEAKKLVKKSNTTLRAKLSKLGSIGEETLARHLQVNQIKFKREFQFNPMTKHRADFYLPEYHLLVEVEGGTKGKSRHTTHKGYSADLEKYNMAQILGFSRLAFTTEQVNQGAALHMIEMFIVAFNARKDGGLTPKAIEIDSSVPDAIMEAQKHRPAYGVN